MSLSLIVARDKNNVIGNGDTIPWHFSEDMKFFRKTTTGHAIIMGHKTHKAIGKALPKRRNIVLSRSVTEIEGCEVFSSLDAAIDAALETDDSPFIIGGAQVYNQALSRVKTMYVTEVTGSYEGDTYFRFDSADWILEHIKELSPNCYVEKWNRNEYNNKEDEAS